MDPAIVDPRVAQRIRLRPAQSGPDQCVLVPLDARCDEYVVLENRVRRGADAELPSEGLLVWHAGGTPTPGQSVYGQPVDLVEAHGIDTFEASLVRTDEIAFPTPRFALHLTDIVRDADGSVAFTIGVPRRVRQDPPAAWAADPPDAGGWVVRTDPVTGEEARFYVGARERAPAPPVAPPSATGQERR
jgi:hypothetical protein